jgi:DNA-binding transcriptional MerR regulator
VAQYSIKELEHLSGIKAHTIRMWEQRYGILNPKRTETNIRFYDDSDLKNILNISLLNEHGYKISKIAKMSCHEISAEVCNLAYADSEHSQQMNTLLLAMIEMDEERFDKVLSTIILQKGLERTMLQVIYPFLTKLGILWQTGNINPAQEHFVSNIIRQKLIVAIDGQVIARPDSAPRYLLFLPEGELHEIGLLFMNYLLRSRNCHVMYLGQNLPFPDLISTVSVYKPHYICTVFTAMPGPDQVQGYLHNLAEIAAPYKATVFVCGGQVQHAFFCFPDNVCRLSSLQDLINHLNKVEQPLTA